MKKQSIQFCLALGFILATTLSACDTELGGGDPKPSGQLIELSGVISTNKTLDSDNKYVLKGNVYVAPGAELTIEAGTIIFGDKVTKGSLIIERGAKIHATGTANKPIVFTSSAAKGARNIGDWGGVIILGNAQNNQSANQNIEGVSTTSSGQYGGTNDADNSGELQYVRIEFAGIALSPDNEINGLTLGSVGSGTQIDHVQVSYSGDDSFEWFGGTVNAKYLVAYRGVDDDFDTDFGYRGKVQYAAAFRDPAVADISGSNGFESDNNAAGDAATPKTAAVFSNVSWFGPYAFAATDDANVATNYRAGAQIRRNSDLQILNSVFVGTYLEAINFDKTGAAAVFKGNYLGRYGIKASVAGTAKKYTAGNSYDDSNFATDNILEASGLTIDISAKVSGATATLNLATPSGLLANGSALLTGAVTVPAGMTQTAYIGAFDNVNNWMTGWTNFDPNNTDY
jgi:hypothetical protein